MKRVDVCTYLRSFYYLPVCAVELAQAGKKRNRDLRSKYKRRDSQHKISKNNKAHEPGLFVLPLQSLVVNLYEHLGMYLICLPMETVKTLVDDVDRNIKESSGLLVGSFLGCQNPLRSNLGSIGFHWVPMLLISGAPIASIRSCVPSDPHEF